MCSSRDQGELNKLVAIDRERVGPCFEASPREETVDHDYVA